MSPDRRFVYQFLELPYVVRLGIVSELNLTEEGDNELDETDRNIQYLRRAAFRGVLDRLKEQVKKQYDEVFKDRCYGS